jgi:hypothetical protein
VSEEPDFDESKEWEDLEGEDLPTDDVDLIEEEEVEQESDGEIPADHGKGYKRAIKVDLDKKK